MEVTKPDKVLFPRIGLTKAELVDHYVRMWPRMAPFVADSPLTLERYPNGIGSKGFRQKNASAHFPSEVARIEVPKRGGTTVHPAVSSVDGIAYLANQGTITFHPWTAGLPDLDRPRFLVLDLDPTEGDLPGVREVAHASRAVLDRFALEALPVASGSRGYHLWVPIVPDHDYESVGRCARALAGLVCLETEAATIEFIKERRSGRVFVDWLRNRWGQSIAAPLTVRVRPNAPVATPLHWEEIDRTDPDGWAVRSLGDRPSVGLPDPMRLRVEDIEDVATGAGVELDEPFDRFGRR